MSAIGNQWIMAVPVGKKKTVGHTFKVAKHKFARSSTAGL
jgi:hypothetical protein